MKKPKVITRCVANTYTNADERIVEFSFEDGSGGLIRLLQPDKERGRRPRVEVYRTDGAVNVIGPREEVARQYKQDRSRGGK